MQIEIQTDEDASALVARFPAFSIRVVRVVDELAPGAWTADAWRADELDFWAFDRALDELAARAEPLRLRTPIAIAQEILTRAQRLAPRTNAHTATPWFARVRDAHTALHDVTKPLVRADLDHAIDTWQWTLRLDPDASASVQLAALLHDVERLRSEADARVEHTAADYQAFKDAHAAAGARVARDLLASSGAPDDIADHACALIAIHERRGDDPAVALVGDADALSFFSLNSPGYLRYFGPAQTANKVAYTLARMSSRARAELTMIRLPHGLHLA